VSFARGVVSTRTFFTERIQQGDIENTRLLEIACQDERHGNATSVYWVLVNDNDTVGEIGVQWSNILWNDDIDMMLIVTTSPLFVLDGRPLAWREPVRSIPPYSVLSNFNPIQR
jgi:hypothetical protein